MQIILALAPIAYLAVVIVCGLIVVQLPEMSCRRSPSRSHCLGPRGSRIDDSQMTRSRDDLTRVTQVGSHSWPKQEEHERASKSGAKTGHRHEAGSSIGDS
jgi:hypothetical protein